jgi:outer membrane protein TolC
MNTLAEQTNRIKLRKHIVAALMMTGLAAGLLTAHAAEPRLLDSTALDALRLEVRTNHPTVAAALARAEAAAAGIRAVRLWEDPMGGLSFRGARVERRRDDGDIGVMAEQVLPRRKLYDARKEQATAEYSIMQAETRTAALNLETLVAQAALELALADEALVIQSNQIAWLEGMAVNAREKAKDPQATSVEPLRIEGEVAQERQRWDSAARRRVSLMRQLNTLLGRSLDESWTPLALPSAAELPSLPAGLSRLPVANPMLLALTGSTRAAQAGVEVSRQERKPVFSVGAESSVYSGGRFIETLVGAKMTIPWGNRSVYQANIDRSRQQQAAAESEFAALERRLRGEAIAAHTDAENAARQAATFTVEVVPRLEKSVQATEGAWVSSKATLLEVLEARRALLNARLEQRRFTAAQWAALESFRSIIPPATQP